MGWVVVDVAFVMTSRCLLEGRPYNMMALLQMCCRVFYLRRRLYAVNIIDISEHLVASPSEETKEKHLEIERKKGYGA